MTPEEKLGKIFPGAHVNYDEAGRGSAVDQYGVGLSLYAVGARSEFYVLKGADFKLDGRPAPRVYTNEKGMTRLLQRMVEATTGKRHEEFITK